MVLIAPSMLSEYALKECALLIDCVSLLQVAKR